MVKLNINLPDGFLDEEVRCDYRITTEMKQVWAVMLDMLAEIDRVCKKHNITYFASSGTMLGAIRHKGFIPWDDDIDIMMMRDQYDKLCTVAAEEFHSPYFFQTEWTDRGSLRGHAQLRNSMTTGILRTEFERRFGINQGIFIDIFPLDAIPDNAEVFKKNAKKAKRMKNLYYFISSFTDRFYVPKKKDIKYYVRALLHKFIPDDKGKCIDYDKFYKKFEELCCAGNNENTKMIGILGLHYTDENLRFREDFQEAIEVPFEFMTIPVPKNYDHALKSVYGDYMKFVKGGSLHGGMILDASVPYKEYLKENSKHTFCSELYYHE